MKALPPIYQQTLFMRNNSTSPLLAMHRDNAKKCLPAGHLLDAEMSGGYRRDPVTGAILKI